MTFSKLTASVNYLFIAMKAKTDKVSLIKDRYLPCYQQLIVKIMEVRLSILKKYFCITTSYILLYV